MSAHLVLGQGHPDWLDACVTLGNTQISGMGSIHSLIANWELQGGHHHADTLMWV